MKSLEHRYETMLVDEVKPGIVTVTLNRPDRYNAMTNTMFVELEHLGPGRWGPRTPAASSSSPAPARRSAPATTSPTPTTYPTWARSGCSTSRSCRPGVDRDPVAAGSAHRRRQRPGGRWWPGARAGRRHPPRRPEREVQRRLREDRALRRRPRHLVAAHPAHRPGQDERDLLHRPDRRRARGRRARPRQLGQRRRRRSPTRSRSPSRSSPTRPVASSFPSGRCRPTSRSARTRPRSNSRTVARPCSRAARTCSRRSPHSRRSVHRSSRASNPAADLSTSRKQSDR